MLACSRCDILVYAFCISLEVFFHQRCYGLLPTECREALVRKCCIVPLTCIVFDIFSLIRSFIIKCGHITEGRCITSFGVCPSFVNSFPINCGLTLFTFVRVDTHAKHWRHNLARHDMPRGAARYCVDAPRGAHTSTP